MNTTITTKRPPEAPSRFKYKMVGAFYLLTFLTGGFFFIAGERLGFVADLTAATFYIAVTVFFYSANRKA